MDLSSCDPLISNRCFGVKVRHPFQCRRIKQAKNQHEAISKQASVPLKPSFHFGGSRAVTSEMQEHLVPIDSILLDWPDMFSITLPLKHKTTELCGLESASELYRLIDRRWSANLVPNFADRVVPRISNMLFFIKNVNGSIASYKTLLNLFIKNSSTSNHTTCFDRYGHH
jgi:hypothetical protein